MDTDFLGTQAAKTPRREETLTTNERRWTLMMRIYATPHTMVSVG
jgi:hypothetical protein